MTARATLTSKKFAVLLEHYQTLTGTTPEEVVGDERWRALRLPANERTLRDWKKFGIPDHKDKIYRICEYFKVEENVFRHGSLREIRNSLAANWRRSFHLPEELGREELMPLYTALNGDEVWHAAVIAGNSCSIDGGRRATRAEPFDCDDGWFSDEKTVILGSALEGTRARWVLSIPQDILGSTSRRCLLIGCIRHFGGLHSEIKGKGVRITVNDVQIDTFSLLVIPQNHSDYFHRLPLPQVPLFGPFASCQTVNAWMLAKPFANRERQEIAIDIEDGVSWDIDYVGLVWMDSVNGTGYCGNGTGY